ncbi:MAG: hypothetical protein U5K84_11440 [Alkalibacterium sp.]|nr:hypothetical protein [Alkalibacterium sp.]
METEIWLDQKLSEQDIRNEPVKYERTLDNVAEAPAHAYNDTVSTTETPDVFKKK